MNQINTKLVTEIAHKSSTAEAFFTYAACRDRSVREGISKLPALRVQMVNEGFHPVPGDLKAMFKELQDAGVGVLEGSKFKWNVSIKTLGEAFADKKTVVQHNSIPIPTPMAKPAIASASKNLVIMFDTNKEVSITFTSNLTREEIGLIATKLLKECE